MASEWSIFPFQLPSYRTAPRLRLNKYIAKFNAAADEYYIGSYERHLSPGDGDGSGCRPCLYGATTSDDDDARSALQDEEDTEDYGQYTGDYTQVEGPGQVVVPIIRHPNDTADQDDSSWNRIHESHCSNF